VLVEADLADPDGAVGQGTAVAARITAQTAIRQDVVELALPRLAREDLRQRGHGTQASLYEHSTWAAAVVGVDGPDG
jgi:hypothetical protein